MSCVNHDHLGIEYSLAPFSADLSSQWPADAKRYIVVALSSVSEAAFPFLYARHVKTRARRIGMLAPFRFSYEVPYSKLEIFIR